LVPIMISAEPEHTAIIDALVLDPEVKGDRIVRDRFSGRSELLHTMLFLTPPVLNAVIKILREKWEGECKIRIQGRGITQESASPEQAEAILKQLLGKTDARQA
jgi:hypothetical protein